MRSISTTLLFSLSLFSTNVYSLTPFHSLKNTWYASDAARQKGYPNKIIINSFGKVLIGKNECSWDDKKSDVNYGSHSRKQYVVTINCKKMIPFTIHLLDTFKSGLSDNTARVFYGVWEKNPRNPTCDNDKYLSSLEPCQFKVHETYYTVDGLNESRKNHIPKKNGVNKYKKPL